MSKPRARDLGLPFPGRPGPNNALTDVPGVLVGATTLLQGQGALEVGKGPIRTGVTAILPHGHHSDLMATWAGLHAFNGNGEMTGSHWIADAGHFTGPICITNTHSVGMVHHATTKWLIERYAGPVADYHLWALPVVAETYDGVLNDINGQHVKEEHVFAALDDASAGTPPEGNVGGGTGMICYEFKGGTGTASRQVATAGDYFTVGALVQANHGVRDDFTVLGVPIGRHMTEDLTREREQGSIIVVIGTDAPLPPHQLSRLAKRASLGIARHGTPGGNGSGDIFLAFSVANALPFHESAPDRFTLDCLNDNTLDPLYLAAVEATEEAVINAMVAAEDMTTLKPPGKICRALDHNQLVDLMRRYGRMSG